MIIERLAELYLTNKQYTEAFASYQQALATYETAIQLAPVDFCNHALKAGALGSVADLHCSLSQYTQAVAYYQQAITCYNTSLEIKPLKANEFDKARVLQRWAQRKMKSHCTFDIIITISGTLGNNLHSLNLKNFLIDVTSVSFGIAKRRKRRYSNEYGDIRRIPPSWAYSGLIADFKSHYQ